MTKDKLSTILSLSLIFSAILSILIPSFISVSPIPSGHSSFGEVLDLEGSAIRPFIENIGQWDDSIELLAETEFGHIALGRSSMSFDIIEGMDTGRSSGNVLRYEFVGASEITPVGVRAVNGIYNYFNGNDPSKWVNGAKGFQGAVYDEVWDGIGLSFDLTGPDPKYEFRAEPFSDISMVKTKVQGHRSMNVEDGELVIELENGRVFRESSLKVFYADDPGTEIEAEFEVIGNDIFSFSLNEYDESRSIIIDPLLQSSTFFGGTGDDSLGRSVMDEYGSIYSLGTTWSWDMPTTTGAYSDQGTTMGSICVMKMDPALANLVYATYIGGSLTDEAYSIAMASDGEVVIVGTTNSDDFPITSGAYQSDLHPEKFKYAYFDLFVLRLNGTGGKLIFSTYIGDLGSETDPMVAVDPNGNPVIIANVKNGNFTTTNDAFERNFSGGDSDMVLFKLNKTGGKLLYSTFLGGSGADILGDMTVANSDLVYITGGTNSTDYPTTAGAYDRTFNANRTDSDPFVTCFNLSSGSLEFSSYVSYGSGSAITLDDEMNIYIGGYTWTWRFEATKGAYQENRTSGAIEGFVVKMDRNASSILHATFIGGSHHEYVKDIAVNSTGCVFIVGNTASTDYPTTPGAFSRNVSGSQDVFISTLLPDLSDLIYSSYIGGNNWDGAGSVCIYSEKIAFVTGSTMSSTFPVTPASYASSFIGVEDLFLSRMVCSKVFLPPEPPLNLTGKVVGDKVIIEWQKPVWDGGRPVLGYNISRGLFGGSGMVTGYSSNLSFVDDDIDIEKTYYYKVTAFNQIQTSPPSNRIEVKEMEPPVIHEDLTPEALAPGKTLTFKVNVTDNSRLKDVRVVYQIGDGEVLNRTMGEPLKDNYRCFSMRLPDIEFDLRYSFFAVDIKANQVLSPVRTVEVRGQYLPTFYGSDTPLTVCPLDELMFSTTIIDNWRIDQAFVEYWTNDGFHRNRSLSQRSDDIFDWEIVVTAVPGDTISYKFSAIDIDGNWNDTKTMTVDVIDNEPPIVLSDLTPDRTTTGETLRFKVEVMDDNDIAEVEVSYGQGNDQEFSYRMENVYGFIYEFEILTPDSLDAIHYHFDLFDVYGNRDSTRLKEVAVMDNDQPVLLSDGSDKEAFSGQEFRFRCNAVDNVGINEVVAELEFSDGSESDVSLSYDGVLFSGSTVIPSSTFGRMNYRFRITDSSGNLIFGPVVRIKIVDREAPIITPMDNISTYAGWVVDLEVQVTDNIEVASVLWSGLPDIWSRERWKGKFDEAGEYIINITAMDTSNNVEMISFVITILPKDHDSDGDGMPDLFEMEFGLDPFDADDALEDLDADGLPNGEEYSLGTRLEWNDTDNDLMTDGWEAVYGLDPLAWSADNDEDGDGLSDLEEFISGTDPTVFNGPAKEEEKFSDWNLRSILGLLIIVAFIVMIILYIRERKTDRDNR